MSEPSVARKGIGQNDWEEFLKEFTARNKNRRARFNIFYASGDTVEEAEEGHLESVSLNKNGDETQVIIERTDQTTENQETVTNTIENVRVITVQYDTDGSEDILEITDAKNTLLSLRFESKVDGAS
jgi:hypothetical protein